MIEMDEGYFTIASGAVEQGQGKACRAADGKQNVRVAAKGTPLEDPQMGEAFNHIRYFKAKVMDNHKADQVNQKVEASITDKSIVLTDKNTYFVHITDYVEIHSMEKSTQHTTKESLKGVYTCIRNAKRNRLGNYPRINTKYLQPYLSEFVYKLSRRYFITRTKAI